MPEKKKPLQATTDDAQQVQEGITPDNIAQEAEALLYSLLEPLIPFEMAILVLPAQKLSLIYYAAGNISQLSAEMQRILADPAQAEKLPKILAAADRRLLELIEPDSVADMPIILIDRLQQIADNAATLPADQRERLTAAIESIQEQAQQVQDAFAEIAPALKAVDARYNAFTQSHTADAVADILDLELFLQAELDTAAERAPELSQCTIWDVITEGFTKTGKPRKGKYYNIILAAIQAREKYRQAAKKIEQQTITPATTEQVIVKHTDKIGLGLDKLNLLTFGNGVSLTSNKQYRIDTLGDNGKHPVMLLINNDALDGLDWVTSKELDYYDEFVSTVAAALSQTQHNGIFSISQVCKVMGLGTSKQNMENVRRSMEKQRLTIIEINNIGNGVDEYESKHSNYPPFRYDGAVLPFERIETVINGKDTVAIHLSHEPPLTRFARQRKQFTTVKRDVFVVPTINKTRRNIGLIMYLLKRISHIKKGSGQPKILYASLLAEFKIKSNHKKEFLDTIKKILMHFRSEKFIYDFESGIDSFTIYVSQHIAASADKEKKP